MKHQELISNTKTINIQMEQQHNPKKKNPSGNKKKKRVATTHIKNNCGNSKN